MEKICATCNQPFRVKPSHYDKKTYCSMACMAKGYALRMTGAANPNYRDAGRKVCPICGGEFKSYQKGQIHCSLSCRSKAPENLERLVEMARQPRPTRQKTGRNLTCQKCGAKFTAMEKQGHCAACREAIGYGSRSLRTCTICGSEFRHEVARKTCSEECQRVHRSMRQRGEQSHRWQGGKTDAIKLFRKSLEYTVWREAVFGRDDFTCQMCLERGGKLAAHHIKPFSTHEELRLEVANGVTLCWPCHRSIKGREADYEGRFFAITGGVE